MTAGDEPSRRRPERLRPPTYQTVAVSRRSDGLRRMLLLAFASGMGWLLLRLGQGELGVPLTSWTGFRQWLEGATPTLLAAALLRLAGLVLCAYLVAVVSVSLGATALGRRRAATATLRLLPLAMRRAVTGGAGLTLATGTILSPLSAPALARQPDQDHTATMEKLEPAPGRAPTTTRPNDPTSSVAVPAEPSTSTTVGREPIPREPGSIEPPSNPAEHGPAAPSPTTPSTTAPSTGRSDAETEPAQPPAGRTGAEDDQEVWVVEPGDSFWSIAEELVAEHALQRDLVPPSEAAVARYWRTLIGANHDRLADPANPDLLLPGQQLVIPLPGR